MNRIIDDLGAWGCDVKGALERMCDDEAFYIECLHDVAEDPCFDILKAKLEAGDGQGAFDAAHTLKGLFANVGLTPMYNQVAEIVEPLRAGSHEDMSAQYAQLIEMKLHLVSILNQGENEV